MVLSDPSTMSPWQRAMEILFCCARTRMDEACRLRLLSLLSAGVDWEEFTRAARGHSVVPLVYQQLSTVESELTPASVLNGLEDVFRVNAARALAMSRQLLDVLHWLEAEQIPALPLKGPALAIAAYGSVSLRHSTDLDILVHERDLTRAIALLTGRGYRQNIPYTAREHAILLRWQNQLQLVPEGKAVPVELHWLVTSRPLTMALDLDILWQRSGELSILGTQVRTLGREDQLLFLCLHAAKHQWARLGWLCDIAETVRAMTPADWAVVLARAEQLGGKRRLSLSLSLAQSLLGIQLPSTVGRWMEADRLVPAAAAAIRERLLTESEPRHLGSVEYHRAQMWMLERWEDRRRYLRYLLDLTVTPSALDEAFLPLSGRLLPLHYVVRPLRLLGRHGLPLLARRSLRGDSSPRFRQVKR